ncbi:MAG: MBL fold metallo-hydrolase, partial [Okeania sp. SIO2D1]|nr:MBL fold metallo-hydrolase [Okeania sp. SIO2D1]
MQITWLDSNSWLLKIAGQCILVDPWLVGDLVFGNLPWLFKGQRSQTRAFPDKVDLIILSQGLPDHAHPPTLEKLNRDIQVVASPNAAKVVQNLGYTKVTALAHGENYLFNQIDIQALPGSPIGPTLVENGYLIKDLTTQQSLY